MSEIMLKIEDVRKQYVLGQIGGTTLREELQRWGARLRGQEDPTQKIGSRNYAVGERFMALDGVSFDVMKGERVGIIGHNGAGKSTLLKLISRITAPTSGRIGLNGRVASMLEVGTGFHGELTGRENIYMNGAILGMKKREIDAKIEDIIEFSECRQFIDTPVKRYSSGMYVKLAFSVAAHLDSEIMIMDEVLAVGDMAFQKKCLGKMSDVSKTDGRTILYVSHNMNTIRQLCDRCIVLDHGKVAFDGDVEEAIGVYSDFNKTGETFIDFSDYKRPNYFTPLIRMDEASFPGRESVRFYEGEHAHLRLKWHNLRDVDSAGLRIELWSLDDSPQACYVLYDFYSGKKGESAQALIDLQLDPLAEADYRMKYIFFQKDEYGNNADIEIVKGLCIEKRQQDNGDILKWQPRRWGHVLLPTPSYHYE